jgi:hypothetical protein
LWCTHVCDACCHVMMLPLQGPPVVLGYVSKRYASLNALMAQEEPPAQQQSHAEQQDEQHVEDEDDSDEQHGEDEDDSNNTGSVEVM